MSILVIGSLRSPQKRGGAADAAGCVEGLWKKVLKMDRPTAGGFLSLTALQAEGCGIARRAMSMKSALRDWLYESYGMIGILVISRHAAPPYPAAPDFPPSGGQNKSLYAFLQRHGSIAKYP